MRLRTRVFELCNDKYSSLTELARAMGISVSQVYRVRQGKRTINEKFIIGAAKAFPEYKLGDLFYVAEMTDNRNESGTIAEATQMPGFREYARRKYPQVEEDLITMIEDILEHPLKG